MNNEKYFRITVYNKEEDFSCILDSNGMFEKLWQFSSYLVNKGFKVLEVSKIENIIDINIRPIEEDTEKMFLRANMDGKPKYIEQTIDGVTYKAVQVADKIYIANKENVI